jgi:hypothetical protein
LKPKYVAHPLAKILKTFQTSQHLETGYFSLVCKFHLKLDHLAQLSEHGFNPDHSASSLHLTNAKLDFTSNQIPSVLNFIFSTVISVVLTVGCYLMKKLQAVTVMLTAQTQSLHHRHLPVVAFKKCRLMTIQILNRTRKISIQHRSICGTETTEEEERSATCINMYINVCVNARVFTC